MRLIAAFAAWSLLIASSAIAQNEGGLAYTDWAKSCPVLEAKHVCITEKRAHRRDGTLAAAVQLIELQIESKRILRATLPLGTQLAPGARLIVDQDSPRSARYVSCLAGCIADHEVNADMIGKLKGGQQLTVQGITSNGRLVSVAFPLADFAAAHESLSSEIRVFAEPPERPRPSRWNDDTLQPHLRR
jgi:invasion protein IalB